MNFNWKIGMDISFVFRIVRNETDSMDLWNLNTSTKGALTLVALDTLVAHFFNKGYWAFITNGDTLDYVEPIPEPQTQNNKVSFCPISESSQCISQMLG